MLARVALTAALSVGALQGCSNSSGITPDAGLDSYRGLHGDDDGGLPLATKPATTGYAYQGPQPCGPDWIARYAEYSICRDTFQQDVRIMTALGVKHVKLVLPAFANGETFQTATCAGSVDNADLAKVQANLPVIIRELGSHGIRVVVSFVSNDYYLRSSFGYYPSNNNQNWWTQAYACQSGTQAQNADKMGDDAARWENSLVRAVEGDATAALYMDYYLLLTENLYCGSCGVPWGASIESHFSVKVLSGVAVPPGRLGADTGAVGELAYASLLLHDASVAGKTLDFTEVHPYPNQLDGGGIYQDLTAAITAFRSSYPSATLTVGEMASRYCDSQNEAYQISTPFNGGVGDILAQAQDGGVPFSLNWGLFDYVPNKSCSTGDVNKFGIGFSVDQPRQLYGFLSEKSGGLNNGDFEHDQIGWSGGGMNPAWSIGRVGPTPADAATGAYYMRLTTTGAAEHWLCSPTLTLSGQTRFVVGGYVRTDLPNLSIDLHYRSLGAWATAGKSKSTSGFSGSWKNIQTLPDVASGPAVPFDFGPYSNVDRVFVCFFGVSPNSASHSVDIDAVSVGAY